MNLEDLIRTVMEVTGKSCEETIKAIRDKKRAKKPKKEEGFQFIQEEHKDLPSLVSSIKEFQDNNAEHIRRWDNSPFRIVRETTIIKEFGDIAEHMAHHIFLSLGFEVVKQRRGHRFDFLVNGVEVDVKGSTLHKNDNLGFVLMTYENAEEFAWLGIDPHKVRMWKVSRNVASQLWNKGGKIGTYSVSFKANKVPTKVAPFLIFEKEYN